MILIIYLRRQLHIEEHSRFWWEMCCSSDLKSSKCSQAYIYFMKTKWMSATRIINMLYHHELWFTPSCVIQTFFYFCKISSSLYPRMQAYKKRKYYLVSTILINCSPQISDYEIKIFILKTSSNGYGFDLIWAIFYHFLRMLCRSNCFLTRDAYWWCLWKIFWLFLARIVEKVFNK